MSLLDERILPPEALERAPVRPVAAFDPPADTATLALRALMRSKRRAIVPMMAGSLVFFFGTMLLMGFARPAMEAKLVGPLTVGYALVLATYAMCWIIAIAYSAMASAWFDPRAARIAAQQKIVPDRGTGGASLS